VIARLCERFGIGGRVRDAALGAHERIASLEYEAQQRAHVNVLAAFVDEGLAEHDLAVSLGYGYDDAARARYESLLARVLGAERALARLSIVSGTHAIVAALRACTPRGRTLLSVTGSPYDTLRNAICDAPHALVAQGILYREIATSADGSIDFEAVVRALDSNDLASVFIQRSRGYAPRRSIFVSERARRQLLRRAGRGARAGPHRRRLGHGFAH